MRVIVCLAKCDSAAADLVGQRLTRRHSIPCTLYVAECMRYALPRLCHPGRIIGCTAVGRRYLRPDRRPQSGAGVARLSCPSGVHRLLRDAYRSTDPQPAFYCSLRSGRCPPHDGSRCEADPRNAAGGSGSPPSGVHADPSSRGRVDDVGDLCERLRRWRPAKRSAGWGSPLRCAGQFSSSLLYLPYFAAVLAAREALTISGAGL